MGENTHDTLCRAALELFAEHGIDRTTVQDIADRAGVAQGTLYRHFRGKSDLVDHLFDTCADRFSDVLARSMGESAVPRERLRDLVRGVFDFAEREPEQFTYLLSAHHTGILDDRSEPPPPMELFVETLEAGAEDGTFRDLSPALATGWIVAIAQRAVVFLKSDLITQSRNEIIHNTIDAALRVVETE